MRSAEFIVVGGGIIGCSVARQLAAEGADVVLLERSHIASAASGRNHGLVFYPQDPVTGPLYEASLDAYRDMAANPDLPGFGLDDSPRGFIIVVADPSEWEAAEAEAKASAEGGAHVERLEARQLQQMEPSLNPDLFGGWLIQDGFRCDPAALTLATALLAKHAGAEVETHIDVKHVRPDGQGVQVVTDAGVLKAKKAIVAAGPWSGKLLRPAGIDLPTTGARGWLLLTRSIAPFTDHLIESSGWHLTAGDPGPAQVTVSGFAEGEHPATPDIGLLIQQNADGHVLLGGSRLASMRESDEGYEVTQEIARRAVKTVPLLSDVPLVATWSGVRPMSPDGRPLIGWVDESLFVATGHGGQGVMLGAGTGRLVAEMVMGDTPYTDPDRFDPSRFGR